MKNLTDEEKKIRKAEYAKAYREANRERLAEYRASRKVQISAQNKIWYAQNKQKPKQWFEENKEASLAYRKQYRESRPEQHATYQRNRRAKIKDCGGSHTPEDVAKILSLQKKKCAGCGEKLSMEGENKYHVDHINPISKGGSNDRENIQILCRGCNLRKNAKLPEDWAKEIGKLL